MVAESQKAHHKALTIMKTIGTSIIEGRALTKSEAALKLKILIIFDSIFVTLMIAMARFILLQRQSTIKAEIPAVMKEIMAIDRRALYEFIIGLLEVLPLIKFLLKKFILNSLL